ncbi:MAG: hypothetical protein H6815_14295 [Phycisphaeraceae bacterium]|nr:hypothetical protein [Phycisphaerales bacterium]MCB9861611.1 hypothetical protein [Phycisphaeraceae bacterium]
MRIASFVTCLLGSASLALAQSGGGFDLTWSTIDCGGAGSNNPSTGGNFSLMGTIGQHDVGVMSGGNFELSGGFWAGVGGDQPCYADCDGSGTLNIFDYICFGNAYSTSDPYADCDGSGVLNIFDYICFGNEYASGCP